MSMEVSQMRLLKLLSLMLIIVLVVGSSGCLTTPTISVRTTIGEEGEIPTVESIEVEQGVVDALREPKNHPPSMPGVYVLVIKERMGAINYWTSVPYVGPGTYELTAGFRTAPNPGDNLRVLVQVVDEQGDAIARNETVHIWR